jgi:predicted nuclease of predicted toxin-antitoxin system
VKVKLDENLPAGLAELLRRLDHDAQTVPDEGLVGRTDLDVWNAAQEEERFLITQELDFSDARRFRPGTHQGLLLVRVQRPGRRALTERIKALFKAEDVQSWQRCFVVATEGSDRREDNSFLGCRPDPPRTPRVGHGTATVYGAHTDEARGRPHTPATRACPLHEARSLAVDSFRAQHYANYR